MKKLLLSISLLLGTVGMAQNKDIDPCGQYEARQRMLDEMTPQEQQDYYDEREELEQFTQQYVKAHPELMQPGNTGDRAIVYTIPIVFHIIHTNGPENISDAQINDALDVLNRDFQLQNADASQVETEFQGMPADIEIEFKLAKYDNNGNCTKGITRTYSNSTNSGSNQVQAVQNEHGDWPGNKYLNIFVVANANGAAGYTQNPSSWTATEMGNGIFVLNTYVGSNSRTLTHEVGHWLNLSHCWGSSNDPGLSSNCNMDDGVGDTPETIGWTSCNLNGTTCNGVKDNVENYMEYSYCSKMFTPGQKSRMFSALTVSSTGRANVVSSSNLSTTGVNQPDQMCKAEFNANNLVICEGQTVQFTDQSFHGPNSWDWSFDGGSPATSSAENPSITYNTAGTYEVSLTASDGSTNKTETKSAYIRVLAENGVTPPVSEGFEFGIPSNAWYAESPTNAWERTTDAAVTHDYSFKLDNFNAPAGKHYIKSSTLDFSGSGPIKLTFDYAYKGRSSSNEYLRVQVSEDCGQSWLVKENLQGFSFGTGDQPTPYTPNNEGEWENVVVDNFTSSSNISNLRIRLVFQADEGNNFFIDNLNIARTILSTGDLDKKYNLKLYPNPAESTVNVTMDIEQKKSVRMEISDIAGRIIKRQNASNVNGFYRETLDVSQYDSGVYLINFYIDGRKITKKFVVE